MWPVIDLWLHWHVPKRLQTSAPGNHCSKYKSDLSQWCSSIKTLMITRKLSTHFYPTFEVQGGFPIQSFPSQSNIFHRWGSFLPPLPQLQIKWVERREGAASQAVSGSAMNYSEWINWDPGGQETGLTLGPVALWRHVANQHSSRSPCFIMNSTVFLKEGNQGLSCPNVSMSWGLTTFTMVLFCFTIFDEKYKDKM